MLQHVASLVGDPAVRHRGTLGGTMAHSDSASDLPAAVLALGGTIVAQGPNGQREIAATDFFTGYFESVLAADEMITEIRVPADTGGWNYQKFNRRAQDWAIVGVAVADGGKGISLVNMGSTPLRASAAEAALASGGSAADAAALAADGTTPPEDLNADATYRTPLGEGPHSAGTGGGQHITAVPLAIPWGMACPSAAQRPAYDGVGVVRGVHANLFSSPQAKSEPDGSRFALRLPSGLSVRTGFAASNYPSSIAAPEAENPRGLTPFRD